MLSSFTMKKIENEPKAFNDLIWYYEEILCYKFESTDEISECIENTFINGTIIYNNDLKIDKESAFINYFNKEYGTKYKTIDEIQENENMDLIRGDEIYAIIW